MFLSFEGIDGAGKTTLSKVADFYRGLAEERKWPIVRPEHESPDERANLVARDLGLVT